MRSFYQDRLGTNIGKTQKRLPFSQVVGVLLFSFGKKWGQQKAATSGSSGLYADGGGGERKRVFLSHFYI